MQEKMKSLTKISILVFILAIVSLSIISITKQTVFPSYKTQQSLDGEPSNVGSFTETIDKACSNDIPCSPAEFKAPSKENQLIDVYRYTEHRNKVGQTEG